MTFTIINRKQGWTVAGRLLLVSYLQLFCGSQLYGQQPDIEAAAGAKAAGGLEALTRGPIDSPGPKAVGTFITFDYPGTFGGTSPSSINPEGKIREATLQTVSLTDSCGLETALSRHSMSRARLAPTPHTSARQGRY